MIKKLRIKLILVIIGSLLLIFGAVIATLNFTVYYDNIQQTKNFIAMIADNDGLVMPQPELGNEILNGESENQIDFSDEYNKVNIDDLRARRFFYVKVDHENNIIDSDFSMMFDFSEAEAEEYSMNALESGKDSGQVDYYYYGIEEKEYGKIIVFAERRVEMNILSRYISSSFGVAGIFCGFLLILSIFLSKWLVKPIKQAFDKQRQFISDANHELKTPLTIISANVDILNREIGDNERFGYIRSQLNRMNKLIGHMLNLTKTEDSKEEIVHTRFDLSKAILSTVLEFESRAFEEGKKYEYDIREGIFYTGDEEKLKSLMAILIDNAIKHSENRSTVKVTLETESGEPRLSVYNTGVGIADSEKEKVFDRFYRSDTSRARETGGYGLGLSIAKSIVDVHKGKIKVNGVQGEWVEFVITL